MTFYNICIMVIHNIKGDLRGTAWYAEVQLFQGAKFWTCLRVALYCYSLFVRRWFHNVEACKLLPQYLLICKRHSSTVASLFSGTALNFLILGKWYWYYNSTGDGFHKIRGYWIFYWNKNILCWSVNLIFPRNLNRLRIKGFRLEYN
jgi:hypothetical protein